MDTSGASDQGVGARQARTALVLSQLLTLRGTGLPLVLWQVSPLAPDELDGQLAVRHDVETDAGARAGMEAWAGVLGCVVEARHVDRPDGAGYTHLSAAGEFMAVPVTVWTHVERRVPARAGGAS